MPRLRDIEIVSNQKMYLETLDPYEFENCLINTKNTNSNFQRSFFIMALEMGGLLYVCTQVLLNIVSMAILAAIVLIKALQILYTFCEISKLNMVENPSYEQRKRCLKKFMLLCIFYMVVDGSQLIIFFMNFVAVEDLRTEPTIAVVNLIWHLTVLCYWVFHYLISFKLIQVRYPLSYTGLSSNELNNTVEQQVEHATEIDDEQRMLEQAISESLRVAEQHAKG